MLCGFDSHPVVAAYTEPGATGETSLIWYSEGYKQWLVLQDEVLVNQYTDLGKAFERWQLVADVPFNPFFLAKQSVARLNGETAAPAEPVLELKTIEKPAVFGAWS